MPARSLLRTSRFVWTSWALIASAELAAGCGSDDDFSGTPAGMAGDAGDTGAGEGGTTSPGGKGGRGGAQGQGGVAGTRVVEAGQAGEAPGADGGTQGFAGDPGGAGDGDEPTAGEAGSAGSAATGGTAGDSAGAGGDSSGAAGSAGTGGSTCDDALEVLASEPDVWALALDAEHVYFTTHRPDGGVFRVPLSGGASEELVAGQLYPHDVAVSGDGLFWLSLGREPGHIFGASLSGENVEELATGVFYGVYSLSADADNVYFAGNLHSVYFAPRAGGGRVRLSEDLFDSGIADMVLHDGNLYWTNRGVSVFEASQPETAEVRRVPVDGSSSAVGLVTRLDFPQFQIAVDAGGLFFNDEDAIYRTSLDGGTYTPVVSLPPAAPNESVLVDMVSDGTHLFYTDGSALYRVPVSGGAPEAMTEGWVRIRRLAVDDKSVYFTDATRGELVKLAKCALSTGPGDAGFAGAGGSSGQGGSAAVSVQGIAESGGESGAGGTAPCDDASGHGCPEPTPVAEGLPAFGLAIDENHLYFSVFKEVGGVQRVPLAGGAPEPVAMDQMYPHDIAVDDQNVYSCLYDSYLGHVVKLAKGGGSSALLATGTANGVGRIAAEGGFVYYFSSFNTLHRVYREDGADAVVAGGPYFTWINDLTVYGGELYWVNDGVYDQTLGRIPGTAFVAQTPVSGLSGLAYKTIASELDAPIRRVAVDSANVYYLDAVNAYRRGRAGGPIVTLGALFPASGTFVDLHSDGEHLYFATVDGVYRLPVAGGTTEVLSAGWGGGIRAIALDSDNLYFSDVVGGRVMKRPK